MACVYVSTRKNERYITILMVKMEMYTQRASKASGSKRRLLGRGTVIEWWLTANRIITLTITQLGLIFWDCCTVHVSWDTPPPITCFFPINRALSLDFGVWVRIAQSVEFSVSLSFHPVAFLDLTPQVSFFPEKRVGISQIRVHFPPSQMWFATG